ncbi:hypothetical protein GOV13_02415 [Candidatus Pacearchaeota archaeon]|nr:hypothetical protein [Candidatus Pacearchaeota archaeon]
MYDIIIYYTKDHKNNLGENHWKEIVKISNNYNTAGLANKGDFCVTLNNESEVESFINEISKLEYVSKVDVDFIS